MMGELDVSVHILFKGADALGEELGNVTAYLEEQSVTEFEGAFDETLVLVV